MKKEEIILYRVIYRPISILFFIIAVLTVFSQSQYLKMRYITQLTDQFTREDKREIFFKRNIYINLYKSGINVFKNYPIFGVGNKNYRNFCPK